MNNTHRSKRNRLPTQLRRLRAFSLKQTKTKFLPHKHGLTVPGEAGGCDKTLAQGLLPLVRYRPVVREDSTLQLVQVGGGKLHAAPGAVPILIVAPL